MQSTQNPPSLEPDWLIQVPFTRSVTPPRRPARTDEISNRAAKTIAMKPELVKKLFDESHAFAYRARHFASVPGPFATSDIERVGSKFKYAQFTAHYWKPYTKAITPNKALWQFCHEQGWEDMHSNLFQFELNPFVRKLFALWQLRGQQPQHLALEADAPTVLLSLLPRQM